MVNLITAILVAIGGSVILGSTMVGVVIWWRMRQEKLSSAVPQARLEEVLPTQRRNIIRDSSQAETRRPILSQLPYQITHDWSLLGSQETFQMSSTRPNSVSAKRANPRSLRLSIASKRLSKHRMLKLHPIIPLNPFDSANLSTEDISPLSLPDAREKEPKSAIAGFSELPTENSPRNTPEIEPIDERLAFTFPYRPAPAVLPFSMQRNSFDPVSGRSSFTGNSITRVRNGSVSTSLSGVAPSMPMPPPPATHSHSLSQPKRDDSVMRLSSLSIETANSSILEDNINGTKDGNGDFHSPALPPCPTFIPFSPYDIEIGGFVGRDRTSQKQSGSPGSPYSTTGSCWSPGNLSRPQSTCSSPRRSYTTRESPQSWERTSTLPRRSDTITLPSPTPLHKTGLERAKSVTSESNQSQGSDISKYHRNPDSQFDKRPNTKRQRHSMCETRPTGPSQFPIIKSMYPFQTDMKLPRSPAKSTLVEGTKRDSQKAKLPSAMKGSKGHRRQNCVRISICPPTTFGGPKFSPMLEEPTKSEFTEQESPLSVSPLTRNFMSSRFSTPGTANYPSSLLISQDTQEVYKASRCRSYLRESDTFVNHRHSNTQWAEDVFAIDDRGGPNDSLASPILSERYSLSRTPSPGKERVVWPLISKTSITSSPRSFGEVSNGSPRRSAVRGPRGLPIKSPRKSNRIQTQTSAMGLDSLKKAEQSNSKNDQKYNFDVRKSITLLRRMNSEAWDNESKLYRDIDTAPYERKSPHRHKGHSKRRSPSCQNNLGSIVIWEEEVSEDEPLPKRSRTNSTKSPIPTFFSQGNSFEGEQKSAYSTIIQAPHSAETDSGLQTTDSNELATNDTGRNLPSKETESHNDGNEVPSKRNSNLLVTPKQEKTGLGIDCTTPGSLYDGKGFLKE